MIWKEAVMACFNVLQVHESDGTEQNNEELKTKIVSSFKIQTRALLNTKRQYKSHNYNVDGKYFQWKYYA